MAKEKKSNTELNVAALVRELNGRRELAENLLARIRAVKQSRGVNRAREIARLESEVLMMDNPGKKGKLIEMKVREASADFIENLQTVFPKLTENDLLLSSFIRMELSNSDIAELKGIDSRSVAVSRTRLKNKLGLEPGEDLDEFIHSF